MTSQRRIILDCEHERWFQPGHFPDINEDIWCVDCQEYVPAGPSHARVSECLMGDGTWLSKPVDGGYLGTCTDCGEALRERNWHRLRNRMDAHHMREHVKSRFVPRFTEGTIPARLPKNSPPPF